VANGADRNITGNPDLRLEKVHAVTDEGLRKAGRHHSCFRSRSRLKKQKIYKYRDVTVFELYQYIFRFICEKINSRIEINIKNASIVA